MASLGQTLRDAREARHISIEEIASSTKIVPRYLEALENDRLDIMPGGFFIRGIIRAYAQAIGLDGDEVVARYKAAGLAGGPEAKRPVFPRGPVAPAPPLPPPVAAAPAPEPPPLDETARPVDSPTARPELPIPAERVPGPEPSAAPGLLVEPAPKPKLSPAARKRIFAWAWRTVAFLGLVALLAVLWSSRRPRLPEAKPGAVVPGTGLSDPKPSPPGPNAAAAVSTAPSPGAAPPAEETRTGVLIEITFLDDTWIHIRADGEIKVNGVFPAGATARARADELLLIHTGNAGGFTFLLNGRPARPLGRSGQVLTDVKITPDNAKEFVETRPPGPRPG